MAFLDENGLSNLWEIIIQKLSKKVDKVDGKGLSTNDFSDFEQNRVAVGYNNAHWHTNLSALNGITSAKITAWDGKQDALVSGTNIKTINGETILGSGNISIQGGGGGGSLAYCSCRGTGTMSSTTSPSKVTLASAGLIARSSTDDFLISDGGLKCVKAGVVMISASVYYTMTAARTVGAYIYKGTSEITSAYRYGNVSGGVSCAPIIVPVNAGDIIYLYERASASATVDKANVATHLDILYLATT